MAFRDHLGAAVTVKEPVSLAHGLWRWSYANAGAMAVFESIEEAPGHRAAVNMLTRDRLCEAIGIEPEAYIDTLGWAMANPQAAVSSPPKVSLSLQCSAVEMAVAFWRVEALREQIPCTVLQSSGDHRFRLAPGSSMRLRSL